MGRKRTGTVYEKPAGSGKWWYAFLLRSGKRHTKPVPARPDGKAITEADAKLYKDEVLRRYELGLWDPEAPAPAPPPPMPTCAGYGAAWAKALPHDSAVIEQNHVAHHLDGTDLGRMRLDLARPPDVAAWVLGLRQKPSPVGGTFAPSTVRAIYATVKKLFNAAVFEGKIPATPCVLPPGTLPKGGDKVPGARATWKFSGADVERLISAPEVPLDRRVAYAILFLAGLRRGELVVLRWRDWDPTRAPLGCLTVARAMKAVKKVEGPTKTLAVREVPVHPTLAAVLAEWKLGGWQRHTRSAKPPQPGDLVVPSRVGTVREGRNVYAQFRADCDALELRARRVHGTRHTFISLGVDAGARLDVLRTITHTRPVRDAFDLYRHEAWSTLCAEVAKLPIRRVPDVLPLWKAVGAPGSNATENATAPQEDAESAMKTYPVVWLSEDISNPGSTRVPPETPEDLKDASAEGCAEPEPNDPSGADSATTGSDSREGFGRLVGEQLAYAWFEAVVARGEEP